jgi:hypothetical protein
MLNEPEHKFETLLGAGHTGNGVSELGKYGLFRAATESRQKSFKCTGSLGVFANVSGHAVAEAPGLDTRSATRSDQWTLESGPLYADDSPLVKHPGFVLRGIERSAAFQPRATSSGELFDLTRINELMKPRFVERSRQRHLPAHECWSKACSEARMIRVSKNSEIPPYSKNWARSALSSSSIVRSLSKSRPTNLIRAALMSSRRVSPTFGSDGEETSMETSA